MLHMNWLGYWNTCINLRSVAVDDDDVEVLDDIEKLI